MKRRFFRVLPLAVAVLLATSCNKDEKNDNEVVNNGTEVVTPENTVKTVPFTLKVKNGKGISKVSYADNGEEVQPSFEVDDKIVISGADISDTELTCEKVENGAAVFTGDIAAGIADGTTLTATVKVNENSDIVSSTTSMLDLIETCAHTYEGTFEYTNGVDAECTLKDDKSYIEFTLADGQKKVCVTENGTANWRDVNTETHKAWVAVNGGSTVKLRIKSGEKTAEAGVIYTVTCDDVIDLGPSFDILWKTENETANPTKTGTIDGKSFSYYDWYAVAQFSNVTEYAATWVQFTSLKSLAKNGFKTYNGISYCKEFSNEYGAVYFPAAGYFDGDQFHDGKTRGLYWTPNMYGVGNNAVGMGMSFYENGLPVVSNGNGADCHAMTLRFSVRLVRAVNK